MNFCRSIAAIFLLAIYLFSATATKEFLKMPLLVEHYYDHKSEKNNKGLLSFLFQHYYQEDGTDYDSEEDSRLPFKTTSEEATNNFTSINPPVSTHIINPQYDLVEMNFSLYNTLSIPSGFENIPWHPPCS